MEIKTFNFTMENLTSEANHFKEVFLDTMLKEGHLTQEQVDEMNKYCMVITEKSFFGKVWDKLWGKDDTPDKSRIIVVKIVD